MFGRKPVNQPSQPSMLPLDDQDAAESSFESFEPASGEDHGAWVNAAQVTLGALRSEFDQGHQVADEFAAVGEVTEQVVAAYQLGRIPAQVAGQALQALQLVDAQGTHWVLGASTRRWYRKIDGGGWRVTIPPSLADYAVADSSNAALAAVQELLGVSAPPAPTVAAAATSPLEASAPPAAALDTGHDDTHPSQTDGSADESPAAQTAGVAGASEETSKLLQAFLRQTGQSTPVGRPYDRGGYGD